MRPVVAIYTTFLQRAYDNIIHDVAIQQLPVIFCMDRAGLVGEDGQTHMGLYDIAYMLAVPGHDGHGAEGRRRADRPAPLRAGAQRRAVLHSLSARQGAGRAAPAAEVAAGAVRHLGAAPRRARTSRSSPSGTMVQPALAGRRAARAEGIDCAVVNCRFLKPLDQAMLEAAASAITAPSSPSKRAPS